MNVKRVKPNRQFDASPSDSDIVDDLVRYGCSRAEAEQIVRELHVSIDESNRRQAEREASGYWTEECIAEDKRRLQTMTDSQLP